MERLRLAVELRQVCVRALFRSLALSLSLSLSFFLSFFLSFSLSLSLSPPSPPPSQCPEHHAKARAGGQEKDSREDAAAHMALALGSKRYRAAARAAKRARFCKATVSAPTPLLPSRGEYLAKQVD